MGSALLVRENAIVPHTGVDLSAAEGLLLKENSGALAVNDSATTPARAVCLEGNVAAKDSSVAILGAQGGVVRLKLTGNVTKYGLLQQVNDGTVEADAGSGARVLVAVALEAGSDSQLVEAALIPPRIAS